MELLQLVKIKKTKYKKYGLKPVLNETQIQGVALPSISALAIQKFNIGANGITFGREEHFMNFGIDKPKPGSKSQQNRSTWQHYINAAEAVRQKNFQRQILRADMLELKSANLEEPCSEEFNSGIEDKDGIFCALFNEIFSG